MVSFSRVGTSCLLQQNDCPPTGHPPPSPGSAIPGLQLFGFVPFKQYSIDAHVLIDTFFGIHTIFSAGVRLSRFCRSFAFSVVLSGYTVVGKTMLAALQLMLRESCGNFLLFSILSKRQIKFNGSGKITYYANLILQYNVIISLSIGQQNKVIFFIILGFAHLLFKAKNYYWLKFHVIDNSKKNIIALFFFIVLSIGFQPNEGSENQV